MTTTKAGRAYTRSWFEILKIKNATDKGKRTINKKGVHLLNTNNNPKIISKKVEDWKVY